MNLHIIMLLISLAATTAAADAASDEAEYERLKTVKTCITTLREADLRLGTILETWFTNDASAVNVGKNFQVVQQKHQSFLDELDAYARQSSVVPSDVGSLASAIAATERPAADILRIRDQANEAAERFILGLASIDGGLDEVGGELEAAKRVCPADQAEAIEAIERSLGLVKGLRFELGRMRIFVTESVAKRLDLFGALLASRRISLYQAYARQAGQAIEALRTAVDAILQADRLASRIERWWYAAGVTQGLGRGMTTRKLQYTEGLRILRSDLQAGRELEQELHQLAGLPEGVRRMLQSDLTLYLKQISDEIARVESGGWQGMFARQKLLTARRRQIVDRLSSGCRASLDAYEALVSTVTSAEDFRAAEQAYLRQLDACATGSN